MELPVEQALQRAVTAHKEGKLQDAKRLYRAILQSQPQHPDANHNLGVLEVSINEADAALPLFKAALEANPGIHQFWLSYIDALIKAAQFDNAKQALEKAKSQGVAEEKLEDLEAQIAPTIQAENLHSQNPSQAQLTSLLDCYHNGRFDHAEKLAVSITNEYPKHQFGWKVLGAVLKQIGRVNDSLIAMQKSVKLAPRDAEAHYNLGIMLQELGRQDEAEIAYTKVIALAPDYAEAHSNLGIMLQELGRLDEAVARFRRAIALKPDFVKAHYNLGITLQEQGRFEEAEASYIQAIALKTDYAEAYNNLGVTLEELGSLERAVASYAQAITLKPDYAVACINLGIAIKNFRFNSLNRKLYAPLTRLLTGENFTRPSDVAKSILSLLKHDTEIKDLLVEKNFPVSLKEAISIIKKLHKVPLLHHLMRVCPLPELQFECLFVTIRSLLLKHLDKVDASPELIYFLSTLSIHCFTNEYVYIESEEETHLISELHATISQTVSRSEQPELIKILCFASYRPLHRYEWCQKFGSLDTLEEVNKRLIEEPVFEADIAKDIPVLKEISDDVSLKVREQYEENPFPRWVKLHLPITAKPIAAVCDELKLKLHSENIKNETSPFLLIAGCGTGQHSIETASRFSDCHVTAVDLSLASLAYAKRKSDELQLTNIDYLQADILNLHQIGKEFDIIESVGVLHHMDEPMAGWKILVDLLKPGGLMKIGLYSELGWSHIAEVRKEISARRVGTSEADIRKFRHLLSDSDDKNHQLVTTSRDFFSLSSLRDLIFHVQVHFFTLPKIESCFQELGLKFCGFEVQGIDTEFRKLFGDDADIYDLKLWHEFEESSPHTFAQMYQFWCQKTPD